MANSRRKCAYCKERQLAETMMIEGLQAFCNKDHYIEYQVGRKSSLVKEGQKIQRKELKERKKAVMTRTEWFSKLQRLVNQYVRIRDESEPCCTCGTTNPSIKYDAGHFIAVKRGGADPRRFELTNIHKQCSMNCNKHGSGMSAEYREFISEKYGKEHLEWLKCDTNHRSLKEQFPHWSDIENEIKRYRKIIRGLGFTPSA